MANLIKTGFLMAAMTGLFLVVGFLVGGEAGMAIAFLFAAGTNLFAYWNSDRMVLSLYGARAVDAQSAPELVHLVEQLADKAGLPHPKVYIVDNPQPNAFATGRNPEHAAVCVTSGLLSRINNEELAGVLAHELSHVKNRDTLTMTLTATIAGAVSMLANFAFFFGGYGRSRNPLGLVGMLVVTLLAPIAAMLVQMAVSRTREFEADRMGAQISGRPLWLASALQRIESGAQRIDNPAADANPGNGPYVYRQSAAWRLFRPVREPSLDRGTRRAIASHGCGARAGAQTRPLVVNAAPAETSSGLPARAAALAILCDVLRKRRPLDAVSDAVLAKAHLSQRDAGFARAIANETLRRFGQLDALLRRFVPKTPPPHRAGPTLEILLAGACELLFLDVAAHAAVDAANRLAADDAKAVHFKPLINATLRRIAREGKAILAAQDAERLDTPDWLWQRWEQAYGEAVARGIAHAHLSPPPLDILGADESSALRVLPGALPLPGGVLRLADAGRVEALPGFSEGEWWVQDFAATLPARLLGDVKGRTVIDLCAAPGGKTAQLARGGAHVTAIEREPARAATLSANLARLKLPVQIVEADLRDYMPEPRAPFVLLDAPCSATGTIRRHPDLPWIKSAADVTACTETAGELLDAAAEMVADGGLLVFAVCSLEREEGVEQIARFLRRHTAFRREPVRPADIFGMAELISAEGDLRTLPCHLAEAGGMDGFYAARLRRN